MYVVFDKDYSPIEEGYYYVNELYNDLFEDIPDNPNRYATLKEARKAQKQMIKQKAQWAKKERIADTSDIVIVHIII